MTTPSADAVESLAAMAALIGLEVISVFVKRAPGLPGLPVRVYDVAECRMAGDRHTWELGIRSRDDRKITFFLWNSRETQALLNRCGVKYLCILQEMQLWFDV